MLMRFDPTCEAGRAEPSVGTPGGFTLRPQPSGRGCENRSPGSRGAEARAALRSCRGVAGLEAMSSRKLPAVSGPRGEARKNNPPDSVTVSSTGKLKS